MKATSITLSGLSGLNVTMYVRVLLLLLGWVIVDCGYKEESVCDKARDIEMSFCQGNENCFPCACVVRGEDYYIATNALGLIDRYGSGCTEAMPCEGGFKERAEACMEDETLCNPCLHPTAGVNMCNDPAFPELCDLPWWD